MRVICIDGVKKGTIARGNKTGKLFTAGPQHEIYEGETYTVISTSPSGNYKLSERNFDRIYYKPHRFIPCSEINEEALELESTFNRTGSGQS
jgi:hypothetical protein